jgi:hypothetical protein
MGLPWVRLDSDIASHDKVMRLLSEKDGYRAFTVYICGLGWSGGQGTDGHIPKYALTRLYGLEKHARMLVDVRLWEYDEGGDGWRIRNFDKRQELAIVTEAHRAASEMGGKKGNCLRWHGEDCGCWRRAG